MQLIHYTILLSMVATSCLAFRDQEVFENLRDPFDIIRHTLQDAGVIDDVLDDFKPSCFLLPYYGIERPVTLGNALKKSTTKDAPSVKIYCPGQQDIKGLTIALTDPDAPSRDNPKWSEMCHWIATIPEEDGHRLAQSEITYDPDDLDELVEYKSPAPPPKTGHHRYIFVLLEGANSNLTEPDDRQHWGTGKARHGVRDWAKKEELKVVGANFFYEKNKKQ
ncbi:putative carboxypeptidase Y inhibitor [Xylogone sp. PMI_703]|nr:putative carboxypeptidase Y inhibitor [Xylogone sp. PMI_703]